MHTPVAEATPKSVDGLDISAVEDGYIIYRPELDRVHFLNPSAVLVLELCDGRNTVPEIAGVVREAYGLAEAPEAMVHETIARLGEQGLLEGN